MRRDQFAVLYGDAAFEAAHHRVVVEQIGQGIVIEQVIDRDDLDLVSGLGNPKDGAADSPESVDRNSHQAASRVGGASNSE